MSTISNLWRSGQLPIRDGFYRSTGESFDVRVDSSVEGGFEIAGEFDLDVFLCDEPEEVTNIDLTRKLPIGTGFICCGEGSFGSEGFFAQVDHDGDAKWVVYLEECNPFIEIVVDDGFATFRSSSDVQMRVDLKAGPN